MEKIKIHKSARNQKKNNEKRHKQYIVTPPKYQLKQQTSYKVDKLEAKYGYQYENAEDSRMLVDMRNQFRDKAAKYYGGHSKGRKMTRFDKMKKKEQLGLDFKKNPVITQFGKVDRILKKHVLEDALYALKRQ